MEPSDVTTDVAADDAAAAAERKKAKKAKKKAAEASEEPPSETSAPVIEGEAVPAVDAAIPTDEQSGEKKVTKKKKKAKDADGDAAGAAPAIEDATAQPPPPATDDVPAAAENAAQGVSGEGGGEEPVVEKTKKKKKNKAKVDEEEPAPEATTVTEPAAEQTSSSTLPIESATDTIETTSSSPELVSSSTTLSVSVPSAASNDSTNNNSPTEEGGGNSSSSSSSSSTTTTTGGGIKPPKPTAPKPTSPKGIVDGTPTDIQENTETSSKVGGGGEALNKAFDNEDVAVVQATDLSSDQHVESLSTVDESSVASSEDDGISRCGVSGLYDGRGNPAALASGWLQILDHKTGRKRHRYYVLCPKYLAYYASEEHAAISEAGFMLGDADYSSLSMIGNITGAHIDLCNFVSVEADPGDDVSTFTITLSQKDGEGNMAVTLVAANHQIAIGWAGAVSSQVQSSRTLGKPPNRVKSGPTPMLPEDALAKVAVEASIAVANVVAKSMNSVIKETQRGGFSGLFAQLIGSGKVAGIGAAAGVNEGDKADGDYYAFSTWEEKGINLRDPQYKSCHEDEFGHPAAVLHGWVTKRNKTGVFAGNAMKDRYFVLTPSALCFFPDELSANVREGYMRGKAQGLKISGVFETIGGKLPLESICEIKLLSRFGESNESKRRVNVRGRGGNDEDEEEDEGEEGGGGNDGSEAIAKSIAKRMGGGSASKSKPSEHHHAADDEDDDGVSSSRRKLSSGNSSITSSPGRKTSNTLVLPIKHANYDAMREAMLIAECQKRGNVDYEATDAELRQRLLDDDKANAASAEAEERDDNYDELEKQELIELCQSRGLDENGKAKELRVRLREDDDKARKGKKSGSGGKKISTMSNEELKDECLRRDLSIAAKTQELRQRLRDDDVLRARKAAEEDAKAAAKAAAEKEKASAVEAPVSDNEDDEDDEEESSSSGIANKKKPSTARPPPPKKPAGSKPPKPPAGKPSAPPPSNLVEVDFGDFSLIFNAHNTKCRTSWVTQLRQWSAWRKRKVDDELFLGKDEE